MTQCQISGCENEATRDVVVNLDGERAVTDMFGPFREIIAVGEQTIHVCDGYLELEAVFLDVFRSIKETWRDDYTVRTIERVDHIEVGLATENGVPGSYVKQVDG